VNLIAGISKCYLSVGNYLGAANAYVIILMTLAFAIAEVFVSILRWYL
jgi:hypothetical protein